jgi:DNA (cytosine-5)-methyltransferase 1
MGFPDNYKIPVSDTQAYKQFGNSIIVPVVYDVAQRIVAVLNKYYGPVIKAAKKLEYVQNKRQEYQTGITDQKAVVLKGNQI